MSLIFAEQNLNNPAEFLEGKATATDGKTVVDDWRMDYFIAVLCDDIVNRKLKNKDKTPIARKDFDPTVVPNGLKDETNKTLLDVYVAKFVHLLFFIKMRGRATYPVFNAQVTSIDNVLRNVLTRWTGIDSDKSRVCQIILNELNDKTGTDADCIKSFNEILPLGLATTLLSSVVPPVNLHYDHGTRAIGFPINVVKWRYSSLKDTVDTIVNNESISFAKLFNPSTSATNNMDAEFVNINGKLMKKYKDNRPTEPYDYNTILNNAQQIESNTCKSLGLDPKQCNDFFTKCQKDSIDDCNTFMSALDQPKFLNLVKSLQYVDPLHITWVVKKFEWPSNVKNGLRVLVPTNQWLNPKNYNVQAEADLMKKIKNNNNLVAFFDAVKATTDAFPAILNPKHTGDGVNNPFAHRVNGSKLYKFGLRALVTQNPLGLSEYKTMFLKAQNTVNNNIMNISTLLGIPGLMHTPYIIAPQLVQTGGMTNKIREIPARVQTYLDKLNNGTNWVPNAEYTKEIWTKLVNHLQNRYNINVVDLNNEVTDILNNLSDYETRAHKAIAYTKVYADILDEDASSGSNLNVPYKLTPDVLRDLETIRNKLVIKTSSKFQSLFSNIQEILERIDKKLSN
jgi:hypothetical protein